MNGYINEIRARILQILAEKAGDGEIIDVKRIRSMMDVDSSDHSMTTFISRVLGMLEQEGLLILVGRRPSKRYKKLPTLEVNEVGDSQDAQEAEEKELIAGIQ